MQSINVRIFNLSCGRNDFMGPSFLKIVANFLFAIDFSLFLDFGSYRSFQVLVYLFVYLRIWCLWFYLSANSHTFPANG